MSLLLSLPGELRNIIYDCLFSGAKVAPVSTPPGKVTGSINTLFICRQIYSETALMPYQGFTFIFQTIRTPIRFRDGKAIAHEPLAKRTDAQLLASRHFELWTWNLGCLVLGGPLTQVQPEFWNFTNLATNLMKLKSRDMLSHNYPSQAPVCALWEG
jgi:hypothetical protein